MHVSTLGDDYYSFVEEKRALVGEHTRKIFRLGDPVKVKLEKVDRDKRRIDFLLIREKAGGEKKEGSPSSKGKKRKG